MQTQIFIDMRCLQGESLIIGRDVGAHAVNYVVNVMRHMREVSPRARDALITGLADPRLGALPAEIAAYADEIRPNAYFTDLDTMTVFLQLSPMSHSPLFVARLLDRPGVRKVSVVHDFVPQNTSTIAERLANLNQVLWLQRYDLYLPVSQTVEGKLHRLLPMQGKRSVITGAATGQNDIEDARRFWSAIDDEVLTAPSVTRRVKPRIAFITPLPPARSGIADYSAACAAALGCYADVKSVTPEHLTALPYLSRKFDRVISVMGNAPQHHNRIFKLFAKYGGTCICHNSRLLHFCVAAYGREGAARIAAEELKRDVSASEIAIWLGDETKREASFLGPVARPAQNLIMHTEYSALLVRNRFNVPAASLPFAIYRPFTLADCDTAARLRARERLWFAKNEIHIVSFGYLAPEKGISQGIAALAALKMRGMNARLHWLGAADDSIENWRNLAARNGVADQVIFHNTYVDEAKYRDFLLAADFGLQLRLAGRGGVSGALQDCIAAGLPTVADTDLANGLDAPDYIKRVDSNAAAAAIAAAFTELQERGLHRERDAAACSRYSAAHSMDFYARGLVSLLGL